MGTSHFGLPAARLVSRKPAGRKTHLARLLAASLLLAAPPLLAATITVNVASDEDVANGSCSLREALVAANTDAAYNGCAAGSGADTIVFAIPGAGPHIVSVGSGLPDIVSEVHIDGYTQPGAAANTLAAGTNADIRVGIASGAAVQHGLLMVGGASGSSVRGLRITGFLRGILLIGTGGLSNVTIAGNFIGTDGINALGNSSIGVFALDGVTNSLIGGETPADRNLISANGDRGILIGNASTTGFDVLNNLIGTGADGNTRLSNNQIGIGINSGGNHVIRGNVIGGNNVGGGAHGISITSETFGINITGNSIGVGADGVSDIGGTGHGVALFATNSAPLNNFIGGADPDGGNLIAHWAGDGVRIDRTNSAAAYSTGNRILANRIFDNGGLGIELVDTAGGSGSGPTPNDADDADDGPNRYQNFPVISAATTNGMATSVTFTLDGPGAPNFRVEFFSSPNCDASGHGEGEVFLGGVDYAAPGGDIDDTYTALPATTVGHFITMTATNLSTGDSSEFSACQVISSAGSGGPEPVDGSVRPVPLLGPVGLALLSLALALVGGLARQSVRAAPLQQRHAGEQ